MTGAEALARAIPVLRAAGVADPARDARRLLAWSIGIGMGSLAARLTDPVSSEARLAFDAAIDRRAARVPLSHVTGTRAFFGRNFEVTPDVLDPRPDTELLVEVALSGPFERFLDLGTGSGAIAISLAAERPRSHGVATDISGEALLVAARNAATLDVADRLEFVRADWLSGVDGQYDLVVSNPPYVALAELAGLAPELSYEPRAALTDEGDGLSAYRAICAGVGARLAPGGRLLVEIGATQCDAVCAVFEAANLSDPVLHRDLDGRPRVIAARSGA